MLNRKKAPKAKEIQDINLIPPRLTTLSNGIPVYIIDKCKLPVMKLEVVFKASRPFERKHLVARATSRMMKEGTLNKSSYEIAEIIDFYGGAVDIPVNLDFANFSLFCINKYANELIPLFSEILLQPSFPEKELKTFIENNKQRLITDLAEADVVAYRQITESIFGPSHPYGYNSTPKKYNAITRDDLVSHYNTTYGNNNCAIFLSGEISTSIIDTIDAHLGNIEHKATNLTPTIDHKVFKPKKIFIAHEGVQTAIRLGCRTFGRDHPDAAGLFFLCTILGGYFNSRLMMNIREEKGYTYNIYSTIDFMWRDGYFYIATEVGNEFVEDTLKQIYIEMHKLRTELIGEEELTMVKRYLLGNILTMIDGPFATMELIRTHIVEDLPISIFTTFVEKIKKITSKELIELAQRYLDPKNWWEIKVGKE
ncbi:MAG: insulinase family protein [Saprospiraceae bacterium]|nr:insulinase family protein [Saprospiraceae bacterium]